MSAVTYAETNLGVHTTWETAHGLVAEHGEVIEELALAKRKLRTLESEFATAKDEIMLDVWGSHEGSVAEKERALKVAIAQSEAIRGLKVAIVAAQNDVEGLELRVSHIKLSAHAHQARMNELSGLLFFYGVAKQESIAK